MFDKLLSAYEEADSAREKVIIGSREIIKLSKKVITAVHNDQEKEAEKFATSMEKKLAALGKQNAKSANGTYNVAVQEYVEAMLLLHYAKKQEVLPFDMFEVSAGDYLAGLCDFVGELQRRAVLQLTKGDKKTIDDIYETVKTVYTGLLDFSFRGDIRRKFDSVKYIMLKLESLRLEHASSSR